MKKLCVLFITLSSLNILTAQTNKNDHLMPVDSNNIKFVVNKWKEYNTKITNNPIIMYSVIPSLIVSDHHTLVLEEENNSYILKLVKIIDYYNNHKDFEKTDVTFIEKKINFELAQALIELFKAATNGIKENNNIEIINDATAYYFGTIDSNKKMKIGVVASPIKNSKMRKLINLCEEYVKFTGCVTKKEQKLINLTKEIEIQIK